MCRTSWKRWSSGAAVWRTWDGAMYAPVCTPSTSSFSLKRHTPGCRKVHAGFEDSFGFMISTTRTIESHYEVRVPQGTVPVSTLPVTSSSSQSLTDWVCMGGALPVIF
eukprot:COSAG04_NODE_740_length_10680_cov_21.169171_12_plen_108_part_00